MDFYYENHLGEKIQFYDSPYVIDSHSVLDWELSYNTEYSTSPTFSFEPATKTFNVHLIPNITDAATREATFKTLYNRFVDVVSRDKDEPGKLWTTGGEYLVCRIVASAKTGWRLYRDAAITCTLYATYPLWIKDNSYEFLKHESVPGANSYLDYPTSDGYFINAASYENGTIDGSTGSDGSVLPNRVRTLGHARVVPGQTIHIRGYGCQFWVYQYAAYGGDYVGYTPSSATDSLDYVVPDNVNSIRLVLKKPDNSNFNAADYGETYALIARTDLYNGKTGDYDYDYMSPDSGQVQIINGGYGPANYRMWIFGPVSNPYVVIDDVTISVETIVNDGEYLVIDSRDRLVYITTKTGGIVNQFNNRNKAQSIFERIAPGIHTLIYPGTFGFNLTIYEERREPEWI